jgi:hypothetical protein
VLSVAIGHTEFRCCECRCTVRAETWMRQLCVRYVLGCSEYGAVWSVARICGSSDTLRVDSRVPVCACM